MYQLPNSIMETLRRLLVTVCDCHHGAYLAGFRAGREDIKEDVEQQVKEAFDRGYKKALERIHWDGFSS